MSGEIDFEQLLKRFLVDMLLEADPQHWLGLAREFEAARSRPGDYHGQATAEDIAAADARLTATAAACRARAALSTLRLDDAEHAVAEFLDGVAA